MFAEEFIDDSLSILNRAFAVDKGNNEIGHTNLLACLQLIGTVFTKLSRAENTFDQWYVQAHVGASVVDVLVAAGLVRTHRNPLSHKWELIAEPLWYIEMEEITRVLSGDLSALSFNKPRNIDRFHQPNGKPLIKRSSESLMEKLRGSTHLSGMDVIQQTGWTIHPGVLEAALAQSEPDLPPIPDGSKDRLLELETLIHKDPSLLEEYEAEREMWEEKRIVLKLYSERVARRTILAKATALQAADQFYYYLDCDYRGRIYYMESFLHYQSSDLAKGLLMFGKAKPLTKSGKKWQYIHAACCFNAQAGALKVDKLSLKERENWSELNLNFILEVAARKVIHPDAESPYMFLAICLDIADSMRTGMTQVPIPVDASQNGSQHAAAINKDYDTAVQVGMVPSERPNDMYVNVGYEMMNIFPEFFDEREMTIADIRKNMSKRAVMVRQYSAGAKSIADNMWSDCVKNNAHKKFSISTRDCKRLSGIAIKAIDNVCPANSKLRDYLQALVNFEIGKIDIETGEVLYGNAADNINWISDSGFPVECNINQTYTLPIKVNVGGKRIQFRGRWDAGRPDIRGHTKAIAANVVHANDSAHMCSTAANWKHGFFGAVHDSYAVHASDVDELIHNVKEEFINMYDVVNYYDIFKNKILSSDEGFEYQMEELGDFDVKTIRDSDFFFC